MYLGLLVTLRQADDLAPGNGSRSASARRVDVPRIEYMAHAVRTLAGSGRQSRPIQLSSGVLDQHVEGACAGRDTGGTLAAVPRSARISSCESSGSETQIVMGDTDRHQAILASIYGSL